MLLKIFKFFILCSLFFSTQIFAGNDISEQRKNHGKSPKIVVEDDDPSVEKQFSNTHIPEKVSLKQEDENSGSMGEIMRQRSQKY
ncbi:MAG: hypothetical protein R3B60_02950 [Candidatus Paceibacterota bacterium]